MTSIAPRVHTDADALAALETVAASLQEGDHVRLTLHDGSVVRGVVSVTPNMQVFLDPGGREGTNAVVRIEDPLDADHDRYLWIDRIAQVVHEQVLREGPPGVRDAAPGNGRVETQPGLASNRRA